MELINSSKTVFPLWEKLSLNYVIDVDICSRSNVHDVMKHMDGTKFLNIK